MAETCQVKSLPESLKSEMHLYSAYFWLVCLDCRQLTFGSKTTN
jgi:hypothetical protein